MTTKTIASVGLALILTVTSAEAAFNCGRVQRAHYGITDPAYNMAQRWRGFQHVSAQPGAVVVQDRKGKASDGKSKGGHVARIVSVIDNCHAIVADERGQYKREICGGNAAYVMPTGGTVAALTDMPRARHRHKHAGRVQLASHTDRHSTQ
jgi:hypothetical protein